MAPLKAATTEKGEKEAKLTPEQSATTILDYLRKQNRPYSATDISANLKNRVTKAAATKLLKDMHERGEIEGKSAGKQIVYHAVQAQASLDEADETDLPTLQAMDSQTIRLRDETTALKAEEKDLRSALREGAAQISLPELKASVTALEEKKAGLQARLEKLRSGRLKPVSAEERESVNVEYKRWTRCAWNRRKIRGEMWKMIAEEMGKVEAAELKESMGLDF